jgi:hypothetical protein
MGTNDLLKEIFGFEKPHMRAARCFEFVSDLFMYGRLLILSMLPIILFDPLVIVAKNGTVIFVMITAGVSASINKFVSN